MRLPVRISVAYLRQSCKQVEEALGANIKTSSCNIGFPPRGIASDSATARHSHPVQLSVGQLKSQSLISINY